MKKLETHIVPKQESPQRLSDYAGGIFTVIPSRKGMKKAIDKGLVKVNGIKAQTSTYIHGGETITLHESRHESKKPVLTFDLEVLFEDDHLAIVVKPAGIIVSGNQFRTVENALPHNLKKSEMPDALIRPQPIHRLDFPTSGLLLIGKTRSGVTTLNQMFEEKQIQKVYHAITMGKMEDSGQVVEPIKEKSASTDYKVLDRQQSKKFEWLNLVQLIPATGRRHQLRIHLSSIGNPILGDKEYGTEGNILLRKGLYLHATSLEFQHPISAETVSVKQELPKKFRKIFPLPEK